MPMSSVWIDVRELTIGESKASMVGEGNVSTAGVIFWLLLVFHSFSPITSTLQQVSSGGFCRLICKVYQSVKW